MITLVGGVCFLTQQSCPSLVCERAAGLLAKLTLALRGCAAPDYGSSLDIMKESCVFPRLSSFCLMYAVRQASYLTSFLPRFIREFCFSSEHCLVLQMKSSGQQLLTFLVTDSGSLREFMPLLFLAVPTGVTCRYLLHIWKKRKSSFGGFELHLAFCA